MARAGLDRDAVVREAARVADEGGLEGLTMAALAKRLGVALPSLYAHVRSLEHLRAEISILASEELARALGEAVQGRARSEALSALASAYRDYALRSPGRYASTLRIPDMSDPRYAGPVTRILHAVSATLRGYGLEEPDVTDAVRVLRSALHGFATLEREGRFALPQSPDVSSQRLDVSFRRLVEALDRAFSTWPVGEG